MDVEGSNQACGTVVNSLGPLNGSYSALGPDGVSVSLASAEQGLGSSDLLENGKESKVGCGCEHTRRLARRLCRDGAIYIGLFPFQARKPYTISKARERWSDEEHQRFVEAVRLHGRAWRKIEGELISVSQQAARVPTHAACSCCSA